MDEWYHIKPDLSDKGLMIRTASIFLGLTAVVVALRIISRHVYHIKFGLEDLFVIIAVVLFWVQCSVHIAAAILSDHIPNIMDPNYVTYNKYIYTSSALYCLCICLVNLSILSLYLRIFTSQIFRRISIGMMALSVAWMIPALFVLLFSCLPVASFFDPRVPGKCIYFSTYWLVIGIAEILIASAIFILPFPSIWKLKLNLTKKLLLGVLFAMAGVSIITGILRLAYGYIPGEILVNDTVYIYVHTGTTILCACLPTLRPLLARLPSYRFHYGHSHSGQQTTTLVAGTNLKSSRDTYQRFAASEDTMEAPGSTELFEMRTPSTEKPSPIYTVESSVKETV